MSSRPPGPQSATERWFNVGVELARNGRYTQALEPLEQAMAYSINEPASSAYARPLRSYFGLAVALGRGDIVRGRKLCEEAISDGTLDVELYVNLARVYLKANRKDLAIEAIDTARAIDPDHLVVNGLFKQLGERRSPVFTFLDRSHPINVVAGKLRHRWASAPQLLNSPQR
ncbi:MAG: tetratricopeptide repeat protein [Acidobacteriota bacterium]